MTPMQGFASARSGLRTFNFGKGGSLGAAWVAARDREAVLFLPATMMSSMRFGEKIWMYLDVDSEVHEGQMSRA